MCPLFLLKNQRNFFANPILYNDELLHVSAALRSLTSCWQLETTSVAGVTPKGSSNMANQSLVYWFLYFAFKVEISVTYNIIFVLGI